MTNNKDLSYSECAQGGGEDPEQIFEKPFSCGPDESWRQPGTDRDSFRDNHQNGT
jgi:hypothetical protein